MVGVVEKEMNVQYMYTTRHAVPILPSQLNGFHSNVIYVQNFWSRNVENAVTVNDRHLDKPNPNAVNETMPSAVEVSRYVDRYQITPHQKQQQEPKLHHSQCFPPL